MRRAKVKRIVTAIQVVSDEVFRHSMKPQLATTSMMALAFQLACSVLPLIAGTVLPLFSTDLLRQPINLVWGFVFGLGWYVAGFVANLSSPWVVLWGALVWPVLVFAFLLIFSAKLYQREWSFSKRSALSILFLSLIVVVPQSLTAGPALRNIPFYPNIFAAVY
jgi:hypothetical protein